MGTGRPRSLERRLGGSPSEAAVLLQWMLPVRPVRPDHRHRRAAQTRWSNRSKRISRRSGSYRRSQRPPLRLTKWQPVAARWPFEAIRAWLLTRTQYKDERINNLAVNRVLSPEQYFAIIHCVSLPLQFSRLAGQ